MVNLSTAGEYITNIGQIFNSIIPILNKNESEKSFDKFVSVVSNANGLTPSNRFLLMITPPPIMGHDPTDYKFIPFFCFDVNAPGFSYETYNYRTLSYGVQQEAPLAPIYSDIMANFYSDNNGKILHFFNRWYRSIINTNVNSNNPYNRTGSAIYEVNFKSDYATTAYLYIFDQIDSNIITYEMDRFYPILINDMKLSWEQKNSHLILPIRFTYQNLNVYTQHEASNINYSSGQQLGNSITQLGQIVQEVGTLKGSRPMNILNTVVTSAFGL